MHIFIRTLFIIIFLITNTYAEKIEKFSIIGNSRIADETIVLFSNKKINQDVNEDDLNEVLKNLYQTDFFKNVSVEFNDNILTINVIENPIIQTINITGKKTSKFQDQLYEIMSLREKSSYVKDNVSKDLLKINNFLKFSGFYFSKVEVELIENDNNSVNLTYDIILGQKALIRNIFFTGEKVYKDNLLKSLIISEESKFWKFLSGKKYLDARRIEVDKNLLKNYYLNNGYYNVKINSSSVSFRDDGGFNLTYNINSGSKFYFNDLNLNIPADYNKKNFRLIDKKLIELKNQPYSFKKIKQILDDIDNLALTKQYEFINASIDEKIINSNKLNVSIIVNETKKFYVDRININGNDITQETVIRNMLVVDEGDPFNELLNKKSINNIKSSGLFSSVDFEIIESKDQTHKIMDIFVEERPSGEISAGAGVGTSGSTITFGVKEGNFNGKGIKTNTSINIASDSVNGGLSFEIPNYKYSNNTLNGDVSRTVTDLLNTSGFKNSSNRISFGTAFEQKQNLFFSPSISLNYEKLETSAIASSALKKQADDYYDVNLDYAVMYDQRNSTFKPSNGYLSIFRQQLPLLSNSYSLVNSYEISKYKEITDNMIGLIRFKIKSINSLGSDDIRVSKRINIKENELRGFKSGKIGPKDNNDYIGGNYTSSVSLVTTLPKFLPQLQNIDFNLFLDVANVWGVDYNSSLENKSNDIKSATGLTIDILTPIGPLNFVFAQPISKSPTDQTEGFRFNLGTSF
ncbi:outer membrane protein assembly factor BamA [Candidatus Pelagibacter sp. Uisw_113]|uniref:outer membrane protein assembly factor BamA n=1 Tax=Candidatus Pelagibacter sp. Uisw_113 TaxID=3230994 RepID=UPI0039ED4B6C